MLLSTYCTYVIYILTIFPSVFDWGIEGVELRGHKPSWIKACERLQGEFRNGWGVNDARPQADQLKGVDVQITIYNYKFKMNVVLIEECNLS